MQLCVSFMRLYRRTKQQEVDKKSKILFVTLFVLSALSVVYLSLTGNITNDASISEYLWQEIPEAEWKLFNTEIFSELISDLKRGLFR